MTTINVKQENGLWTVEYTGDMESTLVDLFDTNVLPTPYSTDVPSSQVVAEIARKNPDCKVVLV